MDLCLPARRITSGDIPALQTISKRQLSLFRRSMSPRFRGDVALRLTLNAVIPHRCGRVQCLNDILICDLSQVAGLDGMVCPDAGQTVCLKFRLNRLTLWPCSIGAAQCAQQVLYMMAVLMSEHIGFS